MMTYTSLTAKTAPNVCRWLVTLALLIWPFCTIQAQTDAPFTWLKAVNTNPLSGVGNRDIDSSTAALLFPLVSSVMPEQINANFERQFKLLDTLPAACSGKKIYTPERAEHLYFTALPQLFSVGLRLYVRQDSTFLPALQAASQDGVLSVQRVAEQFPQLMLGAVAGRSYTPVLDQLLTQFSARKRLWLRRADDMATGLSLMLASNRIDAVIEYPAIMADLLAAKSLKLHSFTIAEAPAFINGYIVCSATEQGQALISRFNQAIAIASKQRSYLDAHLQWFEAPLHPELIRYYNTLYGTQFE
jgi:uncharacterized protein (TIGR02285 family)